MLIEIITIGDELLSGNVLDTNTQFLSDHLFRHGFMVEYHTGLRDDETKMVTAFETASDRADIVLVTGGLGPTADDFTIEMAAKTFGKKLVCDQSVLHYLETWYAGHHIPLQDNTRKQAHVPEGALTFINKEGTAPGVYCHYKKSHFYFMPGVPREMRWLFTTHILPHILSLHPLKQSVATRFFKTFGSPESALDAELNTLFSDRVTLGGVRVGYRVAFPEITLKLTAYGQGELEAQDKLDEASQIIRSKFASVIYSEDEEGTLEEAVVKKLMAQKKTVALAESCTGGLIAQRITSVSGASAVFLGGVVAYANDIKEKILGVDHQIIQNHGAVSAECAEAMTRGIQTITGANFVAAVTGIAGPTGGTADKPVGTAHIATLCAGVLKNKKYFFDYPRDQFRMVVASVVLRKLLNNT